MAAILALGAVGGMKGASDGLAAANEAEQVARIPTMTILDYWGAALSHRSAACLWQLLPPKEEPVDVSIAGDGGRKRRKGIRLHRCLSLLPAAVTLRNGIPVTTPARTIADLRRVASGRGNRGLVSPKELRRAIRQAEVLGFAARR